MWGLVRGAQIRGIFTRLSFWGELSLLKVGWFETKPWDTTKVLFSANWRDADVRMCPNDVLHA